MKFNFCIWCIKSFTKYPKIMYLPTMELVKQGNRVGHIYQLPTFSALLRDSSSNSTSIGNRQLHNIWNMLYYKVLFCDSIWFLKLDCFIFWTSICHLGRAIKSADWSWKAKKLYNLRIETASIYPDYCLLAQFD